MRSGEVASDNEAFNKILGRLENEVGTLIWLIGVAKLKLGKWPSTAPFWALVRMLLPIAESIGDLIYRKSPSANLTSILSNELNAIRPGYSDLAGIITLCYRHSLIHQDEARALLAGGTEIVWSLGFGNREEHLVVSQDDPTQPNLYFVKFDLTAFYDDLVRLCKTLHEKYSDGTIRNQYLSWLTLDLQKSDQTPTVTRALKEIAAIQAKLPP